MVAKMASIGICDDEYSTCAELEEIVRDYQKQEAEKLDTEVFYSGRKLINWLKSGHRFDLLFLDIVLGDVDGVKISHVIRSELDDHETQIIYITSHQGYDRKLFDFQPYHFLSKPLDHAKVRADIAGVMKLLKTSNDVFTFKIGRDTYRVLIKEIVYFESLKHRKVKLATTKGTYEFYAQMDRIENSLSEFKFARTNRAYLINCDHTSIIGSDGIVMSNGDIVYVSRRKSKEIRSFLTKFGRGG